VFLSTPPGRDPSLAAGVAVELVHMATLVHDDLIDRAHFRRGKAAAWSVYGADAARATGDYLFARAFAELTATGDAEADAGAAIPPALRPDAILLADVTRRFGQAQVTSDAISIARRQDALILAGAPRALRRGRTAEALADLLVAEGFENVRFRRFAGGIVALHVGEAS